MEKEILKNKILPLILIFLFFSIYFFVLCKPINLTNSDLGRHIKNGEHVIKNFEVIKTNFYSYTYFDFKTTNHHWLGGVLLYFIFSISGFFGVHLFFIFLSLMTLFVFYKAARKNANRNLVLLVGILIMPLLSQRIEVRPEVFTYLFSGIFLFLFLEYSYGKISCKKLFLFLIPLQILWVNLHIYFFLGPAIASAFFLEFVIKKNKEKIKNVFFLICSLLIVSLINPFGLSGLLAPLKIFDNYGYRLVENQSVWFLAKVLPQLNLLFFVLIFGILAISFILLRYEKKWNWAGFFLFFGFSIMAWFMLRNFTLFGFFALVILTHNLNQISLANGSNKFFSTKIITLILLVILTIFIFGSFLGLLQKNNGFIGLQKNNLNSIYFFNENNLKGPIFNNYDVGGYLIFNFYPYEKVFVDNRPEAYPNDFFQEIYIPMQEDEEIWNESLKKYNFNVIFFSHRDFTPWGQSFLINRVLDKNWAVVYVDDSIIIFLYRNEKNEEIISRFEIPNSFFGLEY